MSLECYPLSSEYAYQAMLYDPSRQDVVNNLRSDRCISKSQGTVRCSASLQSCLLLLSRCRPRTRSSPESSQQNARETVHLSLAVSSRIPHTRVRTRAGIADTNLCALWAACFLDLRLVIDGFVVIHRGGEGLVSCRAGFLVDSNAVCALRSIRSYAPAEVDRTCATDRTMGYHERFLSYQCRNWSGTAAKGMEPARWLWFNSSKFYAGVLRQHRDGPHTLRYSCEPRQHALRHRERMVATLAARSTRHRGHA